MIRHVFTHPWMLTALAVLPVLTLLSWLARRRRQRALVQLAGLIHGIVLARPRPSWQRLTLSLGLVALIIAMAGPRWGKDWRQTAAMGRDVILVVDLSRSMFAGAPSRVELAKSCLVDLVQSLRHRGGHRLALVVFAGKPRLICPLTHDLDHFRQAVDSIDAVHPDAQLGNGTRIGAALLFALNQFDGRLSARDVVLLSDGDDPARDGEFRSGALRARAENIPIHCVGIGDANESQRIAIGRDWLSHEGQEVRSRLEEAPLRDIARETGGQLIIAGTQPLQLGEHFQAIAARSVDEDSPDGLPVLRQRQEWFLLVAFVSLMLSMLLPWRSHRGETR